MARGQRNLSLWDLKVSDLRIKRSKFRMAIRANSPWIFIREMRPGKKYREFSSGRFRHELEEHIEACFQACVEAHRVGKWTLDTKKAGASHLSWKELADTTRAHLRQRVAREGSRKNAEGHLTEIAQLSGKVNAKALEAWAKERNPVTQPSAFRNRLETLSHINKANQLDLSDSLASLKALRPTGAAKKEQEQRTQDIKAIPTDEALEAWLDEQEGMVQWTLALIATYGLRPSEAWHVEKIDEHGWIVVPGEGLTKTDRHFAPPQPAAWVERYGLKENFEKYQTELNERWSIRWSDRNGLMVPVNNSQVTNSLYKQISQEKVSRLYVGDEWVRPYDLRHSYAIRCETSTDPDLLSTPREDFAKWLGHGVDVHERVYLKFIPRDRELASMQARYGSKENPATGAGLSEEILAKLKKLEQLEKLLAS